MGLAWQQGPLAPGAIGRILVPITRPKGCGTPNRYESGPAAPGSPTAKMSCCCTSPVPIATSPPMGLPAAGRP